MACSSIGKGLVVFEAELLDGLVGIDLAGDDVVAVEHAEDALADGGDLARMSEVAVLKDDFPVDDDDHCGGLSGLQP